MCLVSAFIIFALISCEAGDTTTVLKHMSNVGRGYVASRSVPIALLKLFALCRLVKTGVAYSVDAVQIRWFVRQTNEVKAIERLG